jgi:hypothetical protein
MLVLMMRVIYNVRRWDDTPSFMKIGAGVQVTLRPSAHMQFLVERLLAHSCARGREPLRLMGVRTHDDSCSNSR